MTYTQAQIDKANAVDLEKFLRAQGETLVRSGKEYRWKAHDSLTVCGNKWFRHSQSKGGFPVDFVMEFYGKSFPEAVQMLTGEPGEVQPEADPAPSPAFRLPLRNVTNANILNYLTQERKLSPSLVNFFIAAGDIYEDSSHHNVVFVGRDADGHPRYASSRGIREKFRQDLVSGKTAKSILISCGARLAPFDTPQLREIMSYDELELDRIGDRKTAVFFIISDTTQTYNFLVALAFSQMFNLLCERADNVHGGRLPHHVRVLWDEAANTGQVPQLEKIVAVIRSREVSLTLFYQQLAQCKAIYDKHAETILGNMDSVIFLGGREASTIKEISENWLGKATISMQTDSRSRGQSESYSQNNQRLGRELMTPAELATMPGDKCILQLRGLPPFFSPKYDLKKHPNYKYTAEADKIKNAFDLDRLINRRRRPGPEELCEVYKVSVEDNGLTGEDEDILNYDDIDDPDAFA